MDEKSRVDLASHDPAAFSRGAGKLTEICWYLCKMLFFLTSFPLPSAFKVFVLRLFGATVGRGVVLRPRINIQMPWKLTIGDHSWIGEEALLLDFDPITIGSNVCISQRAFICAGNHDYRTATMPFKPCPIVIGDGAWIGAGCIVGPGVTIGVDGVLTAGSVVMQNTEAGGVFKGNPAVLISRRWEPANP